MRHEPARFSASSSAGRSRGLRILHHIRLAYLLPVYIYRWTLSPLFGQHCRFTPTCSQYFIEAVKKRGIIVGTPKGIWRILRCNPLCKGGHDPVEKEKETTD
jgi:hypothetical protein